MMKEAPKENNNENDSSSNNDGGGNDSNNEPQKEQQHQLPPTSNDETKSSTAPSTAPQMPSEAHAAARGTLITLFLRLFSFICTQWTFRILDPATLGRANIQLELLLTTVLFTSREGFRLALTRNVTQENTWDVAWLTIPAVSIMSLLGFIWHYFWMASEDFDYFVAGTLYCIACWIEGCAEPAVLFCLRRLDVPTRATAETLASLGKTVSLVLALQLLQSTWPITAFGLAQLSYAIIYALYMYSNTRSQLVFPKMQWDEIKLLILSFDRATLKLVAVFTVQGFFKHFLTEADRIVLTTFSDSYDQGVYAMGSAYGGMAARILLQPLEENARLLWSRIDSQQQRQRHKNKDATLNKKEKRTSKIKTAAATTSTASDPPIISLEDSYCLLVKVVLYIGLLFSCVGVHYTSVLLKVLAGRKWGSNPEAAAVLSAFCIYTAFMAGNGMTEAFVYAMTTSGSEMGRLGIAHSVIGVVFALMATILVSYQGTIGLVVANCIAMSLRSIFSIQYATQYFSIKQQKQVDGAPASQDENNSNDSTCTTSTTTNNTTTTTLLLTETLRRLLSKMIPHFMVIFSFITCHVITGWSQRRLHDHHGYIQLLDVRNEKWILLTCQHVAVGITCLIGTFSVAYLVEEDLKLSILSMLRFKPKQE